MDEPQATAARGIILVVDDAPFNLRLLTAMLQDDGYEVRQAISGKFALQVVPVIQPDLILLDINMPEMDGYEVCQALKQMPESKDIPVIFISALDGDVDKEKAFAAGGSDYITKPFKLQDILTCVESQLRQRHY
ncbi:MAG: response regulator [Coleofasciculaceae cyanobacterium]|jgi:two-component system sensor histidine kinase/response regulator